MKGFTTGLLVVLASPAGAATEPAKKTTCTNGVCIDIQQPAGSPPETCTEPQGISVCTPVAWQTGGSRYRRRPPDAVLAAIVAPVPCNSASKSGSVEDDEVRTGAGPREAAAPASSGA